MLFDEKEMLELCKKYNIETVKKEGYPIFDGEDMNDSFMISSIMNVPIVQTSNIKIASQVISTSISMSQQCTLDKKVDTAQDYKYCYAEIDECYNVTKSDIENNSGISRAA